MIKLIMAKPRQWTEKGLRDATQKCTSIRQILGILGLKQAGGNYVQIKKYLKKYDIDTTHFRGKAWNKGLRGIGKFRIPLENILTSGNNYQSFKLKKRLIASGLKMPECEECGWARKSEDGRLPLELDHINGDSTDNRLENLRILCPNCHSIKPTHRGRNRKNKLLGEWRNRQTLAA